MNPLRKNGDGAEVLAAHIRGKIVSGEWEPGFRLPTRRMFQAEFGSSNLVNAAFQILLDEEFIRVNDFRQGGTVVNPEPPFLRRYAVLLGGTPETVDFHARAVLGAVETLRGEGREIDVHFDIDREFDDPEHVALYRRIERHGYAGIFLEQPCRTRQRSRLYEQCEIPVCGAVPQELSGENLAPIHHTRNDQNEYELLPIFRFLASSGIKSLAAITTGGRYFPERENFFREIALRYGIVVPEGAYLVAGDTSYSLCIPALRTFLNTALPEALFVANDNSLPHVIGLLRSCAGRPEVKNMKVIATGNYPFLVDFGYPVHYFAYDHLRNLRDGLAYIDAFRGGKRQGSRIPPEFHEFGTATTICL